MTLCHTHMVLLYWCWMQWKLRWCTDEMQGVIVICAVNKDKPIDCISTPGRLLVCIASVIKMSIAWFEPNLQEDREWDEITNGQSHLEMNRKEAAPDMSSRGDECQHYGCCLLQLDRFALSQV